MKVFDNDKNLGNITLKEFSLPPSYLDELSMQDKLTLHMLVLTPVSAATPTSSSTMQQPLPDAVAVQEHALSLISGALSQRYRTFSTETRRTTASARRRLAADVCDQLRTCPTMSLLDIAGRTNCSPFQVSRVFRQVTGVTVTAYRTEVRLNHVLGKINDGADDLTALAAEAGFADHSHMTRTLVAHVGATPSRLRRLLSTQGRVTPTCRELSTSPARARR